MSGALHASGHTLNTIPIAASRAARVVTLESRPPLRIGSRLVPFFNGQRHDAFGHIAPNMSLAMKLYVSTLENAFIFIERGKDGVVFDADGNLIRETTFFTDSDFSRCTLDNLEANAVDLDEDVFLSLDGSWRNYYHWTVIGLGRAMLYNRGSDARHPSIIVDYLSRNCKAWRIGFSHDLWRDSMRAAGVLDNSIVLKDGLYRVRSLDYLWQTVDQPPYLSLFSSFYTGFDEIACDVEAASSVRRNIVVYRALDPRLSPTGLEALRLLTDRAGFEAIDFESLSFPEQTRLLGQANVIVAPHGAGLSNLLYARRSTKIIELNKRLNGDTGLRPWFYLLASGKNQIYSYLDLDTFTGDATQIFNRVMQLSYL